MPKRKAQQVNTFRELALSQHAYERSLNEFVHALGVKPNAAQLKVLHDYVKNIDPRDASAADLDAVIHLMEI